MTDKRKASVHERWAHFRFSVVGRLLAAPPETGELKEQLEQLATKGKGKLAKAAKNKMKLLEL